MICLSGDNGDKHWSVALAGFCVTFIGRDDSMLQVAVNWKPSAWRRGRRNVVAHRDNAVTTGWYFGPLVVARRRKLLAVA